MFAIWDSDKGEYYKALGSGWTRASTQAHAFATLSDAARFLDYHWHPYRKSGQFTIVPHVLANVAPVAKFALYDFNYTSWWAERGGWVKDRYGAAMFDSIAACNDALMSVSQRGGSIPVLVVHPAVVDDAVVAPREWRIPPPPSESLADCDPAKDFSF